MANRPLHFDSGTGLSRQMSNGTGLSLPVITGGLGSATTEPNGSLGVSLTGDIMYSNGSSWSSFTAMTHGQVVAIGLDQITGGL